MATNWQDIEYLRNEVATRQRERIVTREAPYGLGIVPDKNLYEYTDQRNEQATVARWRPVLEKLGIEILGIRDVPSEPVRVLVDHVEWVLTRMKQGEYQVPETCYHRIRAAEATGVPFAYWLYGEEQFDRPQFRPMQQKPKLKTLWSRLQDTVDDMWDKLDPCVIAIIATSPNRGVWCLMGKWLH